MQDIVSQMVLKWARSGPDHHINVPDDFTRLTLDSIAMYVISHIIACQKDSGATETPLAQLNHPYLLTLSYW